MLKRSIFLFIYFIFLFEIFSFIFTKLNFFTFNETPQIYKGNKYFSPGTNWRNEENPGEHGTRKILKTFTP